MSPSAASWSRRVVTPMRLLRIVMPVGVPALSRSTSNTENGRRSRGSVPWRGFTITNWPGWQVAAISGAARLSTL